MLTASNPPTAATQPDMWWSSAPGQDITGPLGHAGGHTWLTESPTPPPAHQQNSLEPKWSRKRLKSVSLPLPLLSPLCHAFPLKCWEALKGGGSAAQSSLLETSVSTAARGGRGPIQRGAAPEPAARRPPSAEAARRLRTAWPRAVAESLSSHAPPFNPLLPFNQGFFSFQEKRGRGDLGGSGRGH